MKCPEFSEILDLVEDRLDTMSRKKVETHASHCARCAEKRVWAERSMLAMKSMNELQDAPEYAIRNAVALLPEKKESLGDWILAKLDFDSWRTPVAEGVRAEDRGPRQCVYVTDQYRIILMLEPMDRKGRMVGQLVPNSPSAEFARCLVEITDAKKLFAQTTTGEAGEFLLEVPRNKQLQLKIHGESESILIPCKL